MTGIWGREKHLQIHTQPVHSDNNSQFFLRPELNSLGRARLRTIYKFSASNLYFPHLQTQKRNFENFFIMKMTCKQIKGKTYRGSMDRLLSGQELDILKDMHRLVYRRLELGAKGRDKALNLALVDFLLV